MFLSSEAAGFAVTSLVTDRYGEATSKGTASKAPETAHKIMDAVATHPYVSKAMYLRMFSGIFNFRFL